MYRNAHVHKCVYSIIVTKALFITEYNFHISKKIDEQILCPLYTGIHTGKKLSNCCKYILSHIISHSEAYSKWCSTFMLLNQMHYIVWFNMFCWQLHRVIMRKNVPVFIRVVFFFFVFIKDSQWNCLFRDFNFYTHIGCISLHESNYYTVLHYLYTKISLDQRFFTWGHGKLLGYFKLL